MDWLDGRILRDLKHAGFAKAEGQAVRDTPAMWAQLTQFYAQGGGVERVDAAFSGATGAPQQIRFFCPPPPAACAHSTYDALAHELGHALHCPRSGSMRRISTAPRPTPTRASWVKRTPG